MTTTSVCVWVQLYFEGQGEPYGNPIKVEGILRDVADLNMAVKEKRSMALSHCDDGDLIVYMTGTSVPIQKGVEGLKVWDAVPKATTGQCPLIVVAPQRLQQVGICRFGFGYANCIQI